MAEGTGQRRARSSQRRERASGSGHSPPHQTEPEPSRSRLERFLGIRPEERERTDSRYLLYLLVIAVAGWALASYDFNLLVTALPTIAKSLHMSATAVGALAFIVYGAMLVISLAVGWSMDRYGRKVMWMFALVGAAVFTGLTAVVQSFWALALVRALASGLANSELAISITLVNEQMPAERRGFLYGIVQGGWPLGVLLAAAVFLGLNNGAGWNWHYVFLLGIAPMLMVIVGRRWVRPSERYQNLRELKAAKAAGDEERVGKLLERYDVDVDEIEQVTVKQLFTQPGWTRRQIIRTSIVWILYSAGFVASNTYIIYFLTHYRSFSKLSALALLLVASGIGYAFYVIGGWLGERFGRQRVLVVSALAAVGLNAGFYFATGKVAVWVLYILLYQVMNGTWSGTGYAYWAESFPTRVRGTAVGWLGAMFTAGLIVGSGVWTALVSALGTKTFLVVGVGFAVLQAIAVFSLPHIQPGQELEEVAT